MSGIWPAGQGIAGSASDGSSWKDPQFHYVGGPNRYGLPPFYELHVWAWKANPHGTFADWNPNVTCDDFTGE